MVITAAEQLLGLEGETLFEHEKIRVIRTAVGRLSVVAKLSEDAIVETSDGYYTAQDGEAKILVYGSTEDDEEDLVFFNDGEGILYAITAQGIFSSNNERFVPHKTDQ